MTEQKNQLAVNDLKVFNQFVTAEKTQGYLKSVLGEKKDSFVNNLTALVANNKALEACDPVTLMYAGIKATALDLPLDQNLGFVYVIPYNNSKAGTTEAQLQWGYRAFIQLAIRSGQFVNLNVTDVREGEILDEDMLTGEIKFKRQPNRTSLKVIGYAAHFKLVNGFEKTLYMTADEVEAHAKRYSQTYRSSNDYTRKSSKWSTDFDAMAKKTVLKQLLSRWAPLSVQMIEAQRSDQAVLRGSDSYEYIDNQDGEQNVIITIDEDSATDEKKRKRTF